MVYLRERPDLFKSLVTYVLSGAASASSACGRGSDFSIGSF